MAHPCPECGLTCYCGGDIDDCCFENTREHILCKHCDGKDDDDYDEPPEENNRADALAEKAREGHAKI